MFKILNSILPVKILNQIHYNKFILQTKLDQKKILHYSEF